MMVAAISDGAVIPAQARGEAPLASGMPAHVTSVMDEPLKWQESATFLRITIILMWVGLAVYNAVHFWYSPEQLGRVAMSLVLAPVGLVSWIFLARHKVRAAVTSFGVGIGLALGIIAFLYGGVASTTVFLFPLLILLAGWLISVRAAWITTGLAVGLTIVFVLGDALGYLPPFVQPLAPARAVTQCFAFLFTALLISYLVRSYQARLSEVQQLGRDLTERSEALQSIEIDLNRAQAVARMGSWVYDLKSNEMRLSDETCRIFGLPLGVRGDYDSYLDRVHRDDRATLERAWREALAGHAVFDHEHRIGSGPHSRWVRQLAEVQFDGEGKPVRAVGTAQDITERKRAEAAQALLEAQLRESQKMEALGTLAGGIAHDFNNVLAAIMGNVELARQDVGRGHAAAESLDQIASAAARARAMVQQILAFSRRQVLEKKAINLAPVLEDTARLLRSTQPPGVVFDLWCGPDTPAVMADATQIAQVLVNLCTNAWHAVEGQERTGEIRVNLMPWLQGAEESLDTSSVFVLGRLRPGRYACLAVSDNGAGMDAKTQRRIFEPFFTTKATDKGTGLGLAVVHGILQAHEAMIAVESAPGAGTTIRIYFPESAQAAVNTPPPATTEIATPLARSSPPPVQGGAGKHVLYVDDDEALVMLITRVLRRRGYRVSAYTEPEDAIAALRAAAGDFDLVVTDYNMPGTSGLAVARAVRDIRADLPVAMASGYLTSDLRTQALEAGVLELIQKPDSVEELCNTVARLVGAASVTH